VTSASLKWRRDSQCAWHGTLARQSPFLTGHTSSYQ